MLSLKSFLDKTFLKHNSLQIQLITRWPELVGNLSNIMTLEKLQGTTLVVGVHQQAWLQELYILSSVIIKTINDQLDEHKIEKIQFKLAASKKKTERPIEQINTFNTKNITLTKKEEITLTTIQDPELREALKSFLIRCKKRNNV